MGGKDVLLWVLWLLCFQWESSILGLYITSDGQWLPSDILYIHLLLYPLSFCNNRKGFCSNVFTSWYLTRTNVRDWLMRNITGTFYFPVSDTSRENTLSSKFKNPTDERLSLFWVKCQYNGYMIFKSVIVEWKTEIKEKPNTNVSLLMVTQVWRERSTFLRQYAANKTADNQQRLYSRLLQLYPFLSIFEFRKGRPSWPSKALYSFTWKKITSISSHNQAASIY